MFLVLGAAFVEAELSGEGAHGHFLGEWAKQASAVASGMTGINPDDDDSESFLERHLGVSHTDSIFGQFFAPHKRGARHVADLFTARGSKRPAPQARPHYKPRHTAHKGKRPLLPPQSHNSSDTDTQPSAKQCYLAEQEAFTKMLTDARRGVVPKTFTRSADTLQTVKLPEPVTDITDEVGITDAESAFEGGTRLSVGDDMAWVRSSHQQSGTRTFCAGGETFYLQNSTFRCLGSSQIVGAQDALQKEGCVPQDTSTVRCVCPMDIVPRLDGGVMVCDKALPLHCEVTIASPSADNCAAATSRLDTLRECHTYTSNDKVTLSVLVACRMQRIDDLRELYTFLNPDTDKVLVRHLDASVLIESSLRDIQRTHFPMLAKGKSVRFPGFSTWHWMLEHDFTFTLVDFNRASDANYKRTIPVADFLDGQITGEVPFEFEIDFASVPRVFYQGGRLYAESGFLFSPEHTRGIFFDFSDYIPDGKSASETKEFHLIVVFAAITGSLILVAIFLYFYTSRPKRD